MSAPIKNEGKICVPTFQEYQTYLCSLILVATNDIPSETAGEIGSNQMGTEEYSDFDSDSGEEWLNDMRDDKEETEEAPTSNNEPENMIKDSGKYQ